MPCRNKFVTLKLETIKPDDYGKDQEKHEGSGSKGEGCRQQDEDASSYEQAGSDTDAHAAVHGAAGESVFVQGDIPRAAAEHASAEDARHRDDGGYGVGRRADEGRRLRLPPRHRQSGAGGSLRAQAQRQELGHPRRLGQADLRLRA